MFKLETSSDTTLNINGNTFSELTYNFNAGWNWAGNILYSPLNLDDFLPGAWEVGDKILSQSGGAQRLHEMGWQGSLTNLKPGVGYKIYKTNAGIFTHNNPISYMTTPLSIRSPQINTITIRKFQEAASPFISVSIDGVLTTNGTITAFDHDETTVIGISTSGNVIAGQYRHFLYIGGIVGHSYSLQYSDHNHAYMLSPKYRFVSNDFSFQTYSYTSSSPPPTQPSSPSPPVSPPSPASEPPPSSPPPPVSPTSLHLANNPLPTIPPPPSPPAPPPYLHSPPPAPPSYPHKSHLPPASPTQPSSPPLSPGESLNSRMSTIIEMSFLVASELTTFKNEQQQNFTNILARRLNCYVPKCYISVRIQAASIRIIATMTIPIDIPENISDNVTKAAETLTSTENISTVFGLDIISTDPLKIRQSVVPLVVAAPPSIQLSPVNEYLSWLIPTIIIPIGITILLFSCVLYAHNSQTNISNFFINLST
tara:strand:+ start:290 stop:1732 length:1443 start_codon:yes stop_codon:yes gene_type:complete